jgi:hypothetical protein
MFETEAKRKIRKEPAVEEGLKEGLFPRVGEEEGEKGWDVIGELWSFGV